MEAVKPHWHVELTGDGKRTRGALCSTLNNALEEAAIEEENKGRTAKAVECTKPCWNTKK